MSLCNDLSSRMPDLRGRLQSEFPMAQISWFRTGGPAEVLFTPADEKDLCYFLERIRKETPITTVGLGSNLIVRDGGLRGIVIRLSAKGFGDIKVESHQRLRVGTAVPDIHAARAAAEAGIAGLAFYRGIPGSIGGALRMNGGAYEAETKDVLVEARAVDRRGTLHILGNADFGFSYRHTNAPQDLIFTQALFQGTAGDKDTILKQMNEIQAKREQTQPIKSRTGGSTFKNPLPDKSWQLIDKAGCRNLRVGGAHMSELHCNFMINDNQASAYDLETLGEQVRARVHETSGILLDWEIKRLGDFEQGREVRAFQLAGAV